MSRIDGKRENEPLSLFVLQKLDFYYFSGGSEGRNIEFQNDVEQKWDFLGAPRLGCVRTASGVTRHIRLDIGPESKRVGDKLGHAVHAKRGDGYVILYDHIYIYIYMIACDYIKLYMIIYNQKWSYMILNDHMSPHISHMIMYDYIWPHMSYVIIFDHTWLYIIICDYIWSCMIVYDTT